MLKRTSAYLIFLILGAALLGAYLIFGDTLAKPVGGVVIGAGAGLFGMSLSGLLMKRWEKKDPELMKQNEIEFRDERNTMIRLRAKARAGDVIQWCVMGAAYLAILADAPLWLTLALVGVFLLYSLLSIWFMVRLEREM